MSLRKGERRPVWPTFTKLGNAEVREIGKGLCVTKDLEFSVCQNHLKEGFFKKILKNYYHIIVQGDTSWYLEMCIQYILVRFTPPSFSKEGFLKQISASCPQCS
jgi:hypothetical protein